MISDILLFEKNVRFDRSQGARREQREVYFVRQKCVQMRHHDTFLVGRPNLQIQRGEKEKDKKKAGGKKLPSAFSKC